MIGLTLIALIGIYVSLFILTATKVPKWSDRIVLWLLLLSPLIWFTWDMPVGYYKFQELCKSDGGLKVFLPIEPADRLRLGPNYFAYDDAQGLLIRHPKLSMVEAQNSSGPVGKYMEYTLAADHKTLIASPLITKLDGIPVMRTPAPYLLEYRHEDLTWRRFEEIMELKRTSDHAVVARWTAVGYFWTTPSKTLFGRTAVDTCFGGHADDDSLVALIAK